MLISSWYSQQIVQHCCSIPCPWWGWEKRCYLWLFLEVGSIISRSTLQSQLCIEVLFGEVTEMCVYCDISVTNWEITHIKNIRLWLMNLKCQAVFKRTVSFAYSCLQLQHCSILSSTVFLFPFNTPCLFFPHTVSIPRSIAVKASALFDLGFEQFSPRLLSLIFN